MDKPPSQEMLNALLAELGREPATTARAQIQVFNDHPKWVVLIELADGQTFERDFDSPTTAIEWTCKWATDRGLIVPFWETWAYPALEDDE